jgi:SAM-dependent methyltransferase
MKQGHGGERLDRRQSRFWRVVDQVPELAHPRGRVADIGCGNGRLCAELSLSGWHDVSGIDVARSRLIAARELYPHLSFHGSVEEARIAPASLELLILDNVIEHLVEPRVDLRRWSDLLAVDGRIVIITPNMASGHFRLLRRRWTPELAPHNHIFLFTPAALCRLVDGAGMRVEVSGSFHLPPFPLAAWLQALGRMQLKEVVWRGGQELGALYGRLVGAGPMLYVVARRAEPAGPDGSAW